MAGEPDADPAAALSVRQLSATLAHELNNVVASLRGFIDLGSHMAAGNARLQDIFAEAGLSSDRVAALAADLEVLASPSLALQPVIPAELLAAAQPGCGTDLRNPVPPVHWESDARTPVLADPPRLLSMLGVLQRLAGPAATPLRFRIVDADAPATCHACGLTLPRRSAWLLQELPPGKVRSLTAPLTRQYLSADRLRLAVLEQAIHGARGHLLLRSDPDSLVLVVPIT